MTLVGQGGSGTWDLGSEGSEDLVALGIKFASLFKLFMNLGNLMLIMNRLFVIIPSCLIRR